MKYTYTVLVSTLRTNCRVLSVELGPPGGVGGGYQYCWPEYTAADFRVLFSDNSESVLFLLVQYTFTFNLEVELIYN